MKRNTMMFLLALAAAAFSFEAREFDIGLRIGWAPAYLSSMSSELNSARDSRGNKYTMGTKLSTFAFAGYGIYGINEKMSLQPELNIIIGQGVYLSGFGEMTYYSYSSVDIPILLNYKILDNPEIKNLGENIKASSTSVLIGPHISIPTGKMNAEVDVGYGDDEKYDIDGTTFGITAGMVSSFVLASGSSFSLDVRFIYDFTSIKVEGADMFRRGGMAISVGYQMPLKNLTSGQSNKEGGN